MKQSVETKRLNTGEEVQESILVSCHSSTVVCNPIDAFGVPHKSRPAGCEDRQTSPRRPEPHLGSPHPNPLPSLLPNPQRRLHRGRHSPHGPIFLTFNNNI